MSARTVPYGVRRRGRWWLLSGLLFLATTPATLTAQDPDPRTASVRAALAAAPAATHALWVLFHPEAARSTADPGLSPGALARRAREGVGVLEADRPLPRELVAAVTATGATLRTESRWLRAVSVAADAAAAERLAALPAVREIRMVGVLDRPAPPPGGAGESADALLLQQLRAPAPAAAAATAAEPFDSVHYGPNFQAIRQLSVPPAHEAGLTGAGVAVAILDTGFEPAHEALAGRTLTHTFDFINGDASVNDQPGDPDVGQERHGTRVWSLLGGFRPRLVVGPAHGARFMLAKVDLEPGDTQADEDRFVAALEWAEANGARIVSSSLGYRFGFTDGPDIPYDSLDGDGTITTRAADEAARRGVLVLTAVGNNGPNPGTLISPADGDSVLAVGAVDAITAPLFFSSRGPTADGRIKPDLAARGNTLLAASSLGTEAYDVAVSGTSYATPLVAGGAALLLEAWPDLTATEARTLLRDVGSHANSPNNASGWGVPNIAGAILFPDGFAAATAGPVREDGALGSAAPLLTWSAPRIFEPMRPLLYTVDVARDPGFNQVVYTDTVSEAGAHPMNQVLPPTNALWWRVRASSPTGARRTSTVGGPFGIPAWSRQLTFAGTQTEFTEDVRPDLAWDALETGAAAPFTFEVQIIAHETGQVVQTITDITREQVEVPDPLSFNQAYRWRLITRSAAGVADTVESVGPFVVTSTTQPPTTQLYQNFPNPFPRADPGTGVTRIWFDLAAPTPVRLTVHDLRGNLVKTLIPAEPACGTVNLDAGIFGRVGDGPVDPCVRTTWDGTDAGGQHVPRGIYLLRLEANGEAKVVRAVWWGRR